MPTAIISREKNYPARGSNYRAGWTWLYRVRVGEEEFVGKGLGWAERLARSKAGPAGTVTRDWEKMD